MVFSRLFSIFVVFFLLVPRISDQIQAAELDREKLQAILAEATNCNGALLALHQQLRLSNDVCSLPQLARNITGDGLASIDFAIVLANVAAEFPDSTLSFVADAKRLVEDLTLRLNKALDLGEDPRMGGHSVSLSPDGRYLIGATRSMRTSKDEYPFQIIDLKNGSAQTVFSKVREPIQIGFTPSGKYFYLFGPDNVSNTTLEVFQIEESKDPVSFRSVFLKKNIVGIAPYDGKDQDKIAFTQNLERGKEATKGRRHYVIDLNQNYQEQLDMSKVPPPIVKATDLSSVTAWAATGIMAWITTVSPTKAPSTYTLRLVNPKNPRSALRTLNGIKTPRISVQFDEAAQWCAIQELHRRTWVLQVKAASGLLEHIENKNPNGPAFNRSIILARDGSSLTIIDPGGETAVYSFGKVVGLRALWLTKSRTLKFNFPIEALQYTPWGGMLISTTKDQTPQNRFVHPGLGF